ncbi:hypothetical protein BT96DRAFT_756606, partial [Gymnopus androsaceus JB14]
MIKMYKAEVMSKLPVMQHFLSGSLLQYMGPPLPAQTFQLHHSHLPSVDVGGTNGNLDGAGQREVGWGDCCGISVPSAFGGA